MKKVTYIILLALGLMFVSSCNRLDILGMVVNRSDTEARVTDWLDWNDHNGMPVIDNVLLGYPYQRRQLAFRQLHHR